MSFVEIFVNKGSRQSGHYFGEKEQEIINRPVG